MLGEVTIIHKIMIFGPQFGTPLLSSVNERVSKGKCYEYLVWLLLVAKFYAHVPPSHALGFTLVNKRNRRGRGHQIYSDVFKDSVN